MSAWDEPKAEAEADERARKRHIHESLLQRGVVFSRDGRCFTTPEAKDKAERGEL